MSFSTLFESDIFQSIIVILLGIVLFVCFTKYFCYPFFRQASLLSNHQQMYEDQPE